MSQTALNTELQNIHTNNSKTWLAGGFFLFLALIFLFTPQVTSNFSFAFYAMFWIIMASALNIMVGFTGYMPFGYVAFYGIGSYATAVCFKTFEFPIAFSIGASGLAAVLLSLLFSPILKLRSAYFAIVSLALAVVCRLVISNLPSSFAGGGQGMILASSNNPLQSYYALLVLFTVTLIFVLWLSQSRLGKMLKAIRDDAEAASVMGINVPRVRLKAWIVTALFSGLAGGIEAWYTNVVDPEASFAILISAKSIVYAMAGGFGTIIGPVLGTLVLLSIDDLIWMRFPLVNMLLLGLVIMALILFLPRGIVGSFLRRKPEWRRYVA
ncbi:branched-chain amino acid ABC transporter permease [Alcaligenaceae bacterium]|nr:branched-chain amino acid ABC transporter permease [Alcaligenaceae bacterium]